MRRIPYGRQQISNEDINQVSEVLKSDFLTQGPMVSTFESDFASFVDAKYAIAVANGTAALHLCALALGVKPNTRVISTPITFAASVNCISYCGGEVELVDTNENGLIDLEKLEELISSRPPGWFSGVVSVAYAGQPVNTEKLRSIADKHSLWIIEDACHAPGGFLEDTSGDLVNCGSNKYADLSIFSFHPVKHIACGEGGMVTTNNEELKKKIELLRTHGITKDPNVMGSNHGGWYYEMQDLGYNYRLSDIQAALGVSQLSRIEENLRSRRALAKKYDSAFEREGIRYIPNNNVSGHAYHLYVIKVNNRLELYNKLRESGVFCQVHYIPIHYLPFYQSKMKVSLPVAEKFYEECLSIPMYHSLSEEDQMYVIEKVIQYSR